MPRSGGRSSRSSVARRLEKNKEHEPSRSCESLFLASDQPESVSNSHANSRAHSVDARPQENVTCSFFILFRRKKKSDNTTFRDTEDTNFTQKQFSCVSSTPQSRPVSESSLCLSHKDCRESSKQSQTSSRLLHTSLSSNPSRAVPQTSYRSLNTKPSHYLSRSRSKHRCQRQLHSRAHKSHSDDFLRFEDFPPHPSLSRSTPEITVIKESNNTHLKNGIKDVSCDNSNSINIHKNNCCDFAARKYSSQESPASLRPVHVSLESGHNQRESNKDFHQTVEENLQKSLSKSLIEKDLHYHLANSSDNWHRKYSLQDVPPQNVREKSQIGRSKSNKEDLHQCTTSRSDKQSGRSFRSQSLPSFGSNRYQVDPDTRVISDAEDFELKPTDMTGPLHLSLCGCGFLGIYHLGVVKCLSQRGPSFLKRVEKVGGASAGALIAAVLVTAPNKMEESRDHIHKLAHEIRKKVLGTFTPGYSFANSLRHMLNDVVPEDAHERAQGKLFISLTNADTKKNELLSDFRSRDELIEALVASCFIPGYAGIKLPSVRGKKYMDGGLSDNLPQFDTGRTITVSPFDGKSDIGPKQGQEAELKAHFISVHNQDIQVSMNNVKKGAHAFFPPKSQMLQEYFEKGCKDTSRFLIREGFYEITYPLKPKTVLYESSV